MKYNISDIKSLTDYFYHSNFTNNVYKKSNK